MPADPNTPSDTPDQGPPTSAPTGGPDWRMAIALRWHALGLELLRFGSTPRRRLSEFARECDELAVLVAWFENDGNLTHAAQQFGTSRRAFRVRFVAWRQRNPHFMPRPPERRHRPGRREQTGSETK